MFVAAALAAAVLCTAAGILFSVWLVSRTAALQLREQLLIAASKTQLKASLFRATSGGRPVALVTGANSGIGLALCHTLASMGVDVVLGCRSEARGKAAVDAIKTAHPDAHPHLLIVDVSSLFSVRAAAAEFHARFARLDVLVCNAGIFPVAGYNWVVALRAFAAFRIMEFFVTGRNGPASNHFLVQPPPAQSVDGVDSLFATHVLGHVHLVDGLKDRLISSKGRVLWTGSRAACPLSVCVPGVPGLETPTHAGDAYGSAKSCQDLACRAIDEQLAPHGVRSAIVCPGFVDTDIAPPFFRLFRPILYRMRPVLHSFQITPARGSSVLLHVAALSPDAVQSDVKYVMRHGQLATARYGVSTSLVDVQSPTGAAMPSVSLSAVLSAYGGVPVANAKSGLVRHRLVAHCLKLRPKMPPKSPPPTS